ncbi:MAG TPA: deoxyribose-phosphate aldolase [Patescibacteria group bacterium]|nr:deoxyribose-phosphate aldolase [Patescibacteria group bacterium]
MKNFPGTLAGLVEKAKAATASESAALTTLHSLDLTSLNDTDTPAVIDTLIAKADQGKLGHVAATCVYPQFLTQTFNATAKKGIARATVINFPSGHGTPDQTAADTRTAIKSGANEIDIVLDHEAFLSGNSEKAAQLLRSCRDACGPDVKLKVILESSAFTDYKDLYAASVLALDAGADFLKTSTGKHATGGASLDAVATMLQSIRDTGFDAGVKVSGGVKTVTDGAQYIALTESMMGGDWIRPEKFRIGASGVLTDILKTLGQSAGPPPAMPPVY